MPLNGRRIKISKLRRLEIQRDGTLRIDLCQRLGENRQIVMLLQGKLCLVGLDFLQMIMGILDGTELRDDLCGSLLSDSRNAWQA